MLATGFALARAVLRPQDRARTATKARAEGSCHIPGPVLPRTGPLCSGLERLVL